MMMNAQERSWPRKPTIAEKRKTANRLVLRMPPWLRMAYDYQEGADYVEALTRWIEGETGKTRDQLWMEWLEHVQECQIKDSETIYHHKSHVTGDWKPIGRPPK